MQKIPVQSLKPTHRYFRFFRKELLTSIAISELGSVSNERSGNFAFCRDIHECLNSPIFEKIMVFEILCCSFNFTEFYVKWKLEHRILKKVILKKYRMNHKMRLKIMELFNHHYIQEGKHQQY